MFYDLDILSRRGGKFAIIWLAANRKLRLKGKSYTRKDLGLLLSVKIDRMCNDIIRYVKIQHPARAPGELSPRFSLYLSAMLTHGTVLVCHLQVKHTAAHTRLTLHSNTLKQKQISLNCIERDSSITHTDTSVDSTTRHQELVEHNFENLNTVLDNLRICDANSCEHPSFTETQLCPQTPERIENDFKELEAAFSDAYKNPNGHFASECDITMKESDLLLDMENRLQELQMVEDTTTLHYPSKTILDWEEALLPPILDLKESNEENNLKRNHTDTTIEDNTIPRKQNCMGINGPGSEIIDSNNKVDIVLEPILDSPITPLRRRRFQRLIIDKETTIDIETFKAQLDEFANTLRCKRGLDDCIIPQYAGCSAMSFFRRPSVAMLTPLKELVTRHMNVRSIKQDFDGTSIAPHLTHLSWGMEEASVHEKELTAVIHSEQSEPFQHLKLVNETDSHERLHDETISDVEVLRPGLSREASYTGSLVTMSTSRLDASVPDSVRVSPVLAERVVGLETLKEVSIEMSLQNSRLTKSGAPSIENPLRPRAAHETLFEDSENITDIQDEKYNKSSRALNEAVPQPIQSIVAHHFPETEHTSPSFTKSIVLSTSAVEVPEKQDLVNMITTMTDEASGFLTFRNLVPLTKYDSIEAAKIFDRLLRLKNEFKIEMHQEFSLSFPYEDIVIRLAHVSTRISL